jgi:hypothetical protein
MEENFAYVKYATPAELTKQFSDDLSTLPQATYNDKGLPIEEDAETTRKYKVAREKFDEKYKDVDFYIKENETFKKLGNIIFLKTVSFFDHTPLGLSFIDENKQYHNIDKDSHEDIYKLQHLPGSSHGEKSSSHSPSRKKRGRSLSPLPFAQSSSRSPPRSHHTVQTTQGNNSNKKFLSLQKPGGKRKQKTKRRKSRRHSKKHIAKQ